jgi:hypothetical protein
MNLQDVKDFFADPIGTVVGAWQARRDRRETEQAFASIRANIQDAAAQRRDQPEPAVHVPTAERVADAAVNAVMDWSQTEMFGQWNAKTGTFEQPANQNTAVFAEHFADMIQDRLSGLSADEQARAINVLDSATVYTGLVSPDGRVDRSPTVESVAQEWAELGAAQKQASFMVDRTLHHIQGRDDLRQEGMEFEMPSADRDTNSEQTALLSAREAVTKIQEQVSQDLQTLSPDAEGQRVGLQRQMERMGQFASRIDGAMTTDIGIDGVASIMHDLEDAGVSLNTGTSVREEPTYIWTAEQQKNLDESLALQRAINKEVEAGFETNRPAEPTYVWTADDQKTLDESLATQREINKEVDVAHSTRGESTYDHARDSLDEEELEL